MWGMDEPSPAAGPWIKVSERLPEIHRLVIIKTVCGFYRLAEFGGVNFVTTNGGCLHKNNAAYWAEINPPAEENLKYRAEKSDNDHKE